MTNPVASIALLLALLLALLFQPNHHATDLFSGNILLLTAHPDDECMFFAPTLRALTRPDTHVFSLCLSAGDADGLGLIRRGELGRSLDILGIPPSRRWVVDHPSLQDNFTAHWDADIIAAVLQRYVTSHNISTILTFDAGGISGHPNHRSLPKGAVRLLEQRTHTFTLYTLITRPVLVKYTGILAPLHAKFSLAQDRLYPLLHTRIIELQRALQLATNPISKQPQAPPATVVSGIPNYVTALNAMRAHKSQLVWFRWLYVLFSRYMWVNEWAEFQIDS
ncbi:hypothetical protein D9615_007426 [Tricholomella constricta]|uniref:N-acetylglucosaminylphosphatidylinositol deacetylase n=1 Tax=Tricholomella constricta TaxID=117010 RepID=A0A8H5GYH9_9AGAR|nr:hypothetical protein D9615_007426 [Tricholomella constricta]